MRAHLVGLFRASIRAKGPGPTAADYDPWTPPDDAGGALDDGDMTGFDVWRKLAEEGVLPKAKP